MTNADMVYKFHQIFGHSIGDVPRTLVPSYQELRAELIREEFEDEYLPAVARGDVVEMADALTDILYVTYGAMIAHGFPADELFAEVQRSNMSKLGEDGMPIYREDGKVMKGPSYSPPDIAGILRKHGWQG